MTAPDDGDGPDNLVFGPAHHNDTLHGHGHMPGAPPLREDGRHEHGHVHPGEVAGHVHVHRHAPENDSGS